MLNTWQKSPVMMDGLLIYTEEINCPDTTPVKREPKATKPERSEKMRSDYALFLEWLDPANVYLVGP